VSFQLYGRLIFWGMGLQTMMLGKKRAVILAMDATLLALSTCHRPECTGNPIGAKNLLIILEPNVNSACLSEQPWVVVFIYI